MVLFDALLSFELGMSFARRRSSDIELGATLSTPKVAHHRAWSVAGEYILETAKSCISAPSLLHSILQDALQELRKTGLYHQSHESCKLYFLALRVKRG